MVYMLQEGPYIKLGYSSQTPWDRRLHQIRNATPRDVVVIAARPGTIEQEQELHRGAKQWKHRGDWYNDCRELRRYCDAFFFADREVTYESETLPEVASDPVSKSVHSLVSSNESVQTEPRFGD